MSEQGDRGGREFAPAEVDDFEAEVAAVSRHQELLSFLEQRSHDVRTYSLGEVRALLEAARRPGCGQAGGGSGSACD